MLTTPCQEIFETMLVDAGPEHPEVYSADAGVWERPLTLKLRQSDVPLTRMLTRMLFANIFTNVNITELLLLFWVRHGDVIRSAMHSLCTHRLFREPCLDQRVLHGVV